MQHTDLVSKFLRLRPEQAAYVMALVDDALTGGDLLHRASVDGFSPALLSRSTMVTFAGM